MQLPLFKVLPCSRCRGRSNPRRCMNDEFLSMANIHLSALPQLLIRITNSHVHMLFLMRKAQVPAFNYVWQSFFIIDQTSISGLQCLTASSDADATG